MNEANRGESEGEAYRKNLEMLVNARTEQLRQACFQISDLLELLKRMQSMQSLEDIHQAIRTELAKRESERPPSPRFGGNPGEPVPEVDPDDLKNLWQLQQEVQAQNAGQQVGIDMEVMKQLCKPEADIHALSYRTSLLWMMIKLEPERFASFTKDGQPIESAFDAAAKVPAEWMGVGNVRESPPFDVNEFVRLCNAA